MLVKCIIKVFLYLILAVMTLIHWLLKIPMILGKRAFQVLCKQKKLI